MTRSNPRDPSIDVTVIVPLAERPESLAGLYREYSDALLETGRAVEFLFVAQPFQNGLTRELDELRDDGEPIRVVFARQIMGEASLLKLAVQHCRGHILVTLPAYYRVAAEGLPGLVAAVEEGADMALARRWPRHDSLVNRAQTRLFHGLVRRLARGRVRDIGCGVQAMRREVLEQLPLYGDLYRFLPLLAIQEGFGVVELDVEQHPRDRRTRVYSVGVYVRRLFDVLGLLFLFRFTYKPLRFFGLVGSAFSMAGLVVLAVLFIQRVGGQGIADRPLLLLGVLLLTLGVQAIALGLIGEIIVHLNVPGRTLYRVRGVAPEDDS
jgi:hypothetical protein